MSVQCHAATNLATYIATQISARNNLNISIGVSKALCFWVVRRCVSTFATIHWQMSSPPSPWWNRWRLLSTRSAQSSTATAGRRSTVGEFSAFQQDSAPTLRVHETTDFLSRGAVDSISPLTWHRLHQTQTIWCVALAHPDSPIRGGGQLSPPYLPSLSLPFSSPSPFLPSP